MRSRTFVSYLLIPIGVWMLTATYAPAVERSVYAAPAATAAKIADYDFEGEPEEIARSGNWVQTVVPSGALVWVYGRYVDVDAGRGRVTSSGVRMRPRPSTGVDSRPIGAFNAGEQVEVVESRGDWKRVRVFSPVAGWIRIDPQPVAAGASIAPVATPQPETDNREVLRRVPAPPATRVTTRAEDNSLRAGSKPVPASTAGGRYVIGVSDSVSIEVRNLGAIEFSLDFRVPSNGVISIPLLNEIDIAGYTSQEIENLLEQRLRGGYLKGPEVSVRVAEYRPFYINGAVNNPGAFPFQINLTVQKAIALAGGFNEYADAKNILLAREGESDEQAEKVNLAARVNPGDVIIVNPGVAREDAQHFIYLYGEVNKPGSYEYREGMTVEKAVVLAGGFGERASKKKITIRRGGGESPEVLKRVKLFAEVKPGDVLTVGQSIF